MLTYVQIFEKLKLKKLKKQQLTLIPC